jgi:nucleoside-diphosphate-sugar epimerase
MKVLVTGATGFVGAALVRRLVEQGKEVHIFRRRESALWRIHDLLDKLISHEVDLRDAAAVERSVANIRPTIIYHLATYGGFADQRDTAAIIAANFLGTVHLLRACEKVGFDCFVNTGSSSEYGIKAAPMRESDTTEPLGDYGVAKAAATLFCRSEAMQQGLPVVTLRLFSPYGPWDDPKRFISYVIKSLLRGDAPRLSSPDSVRDYIYIDDVVDLYLKVGKAPQCAGEIINVGSGVQSSLGEVVSLVNEIIGNGITPIWGTVPSQRAEPQSWVADINKAKLLLGWEPATPLRAGLRQTVEWLREHQQYYL